MRAIIIIHPRPQHNTSLGELVNPKTVIAVGVKVMSLSEPI